MDAYVHARTVMANAIVASLLPDGVVKGGSALKMRFGDAALDSPSIWTRPRLPTPSFTRSA